MAQVNVTVGESPLANASAPSNTGTLFVAGLSDQGPPLSGPAAILCQSLTDYTNAFGPRSGTSSTLYDTLDEFYADGGAQAYVTRVTDNTATKATLTLQDAVPHPTVTVTAQTAGTDGNAIFVAVTTDGGNFTVLIEDSSGDVLETHGPYGAQSSLLADASSALVTFSQSSGSGFTTANPAALSSTALSGGTDASDLTDTSYASALANFPAALGPGTVMIPGRTSQVVAQAVFAHAATNNRFAVVDQADAATSAAAVAAAIALAIPSGQKSYGVLIQGSLILPGLVPSTTRTVPGSAAVAALRAQVAASPHDNKAPAGLNWPLTRPIGFTTAFANQSAGGLAWNQGDANSMKAAGVNYFASLFGVNCLDEFVTPVSPSVDLIFWQATATTERMALVADCLEAGLQFEFAPIDGQGNTLTALHGALSTIVQDHWNAGALYGDTASDAASIVTGPPVNTPATAQAGQLNAQLAVKVTPYADVINVTINVLSLTQSVGASA